MTAAVSAALVSARLLSLAIPDGGERTEPRVEAEVQAALLREVFGNPFWPVDFSPEWRTDTAVSLGGRCTSRGSSCRDADSRGRTAKMRGGVTVEDVLNHRRAARWASMCVGAGWSTGFSERGKDAKASGVRFGRRLGANGECRPMKGVVDGQLAG